MKRVWIGGILMAVLLTVGLLAGWAMNRGLINSVYPIYLYLSV